MSTAPERRSRRNTPPSGSMPARLARAWRNLEAEQRRVVLASVVLLLTMFLPWYSRSTYAKGAKSLQTAHENVSAITTFTFVEAAIFLVAVGVTLLILARGEQRAFHLPGGDGTIITGAGAWATFLVFYRFVDQPSGAKSDNILYDYGLHWGIFFGLLAALFLAFAGNALRTAHVVEPALPGDVAPSTGAPPAGAEYEDPAPRPPAPESRDTRPRVSRDRAPTVVAPRTSAGRQAQEEGDSEQLSFEDSRRRDDDDAPTRRAPQLPFGDPPEFEVPPKDS
jgi:hypothetical protein